MKVVVKSNLSKETIKKHEPFIIKGIQTIRKYTNQDSHLQIEIIKKFDDLSLIVTGEFSGKTKTFEKSSAMNSLFDNVIEEIKESEPIRNNDNSLITLIVNPEVKNEKKERTYKQSYAALAIKVILLFLSMSVIYATIFIFKSNNDTIFKIYDSFISNVKNADLNFKELFIVFMSSLNGLLSAIVIVVIVFKINAKENSGSKLAIFIGCISFVLYLLITNSQTNNHLFWAALAMCIVGITATYVLPYREVINKEEKQDLKNTPIRTIISPVRNIGKIVLALLVLANLILSIFVFIKSTSPAISLSMIDFVDVVLANITTLGFIPVMLLILCIGLLFLGFMAIIYNVDTFNRKDKYGLVVSLIYGITSIITTLLIYREYGVLTGQIGLIISLMIIIISIVFLSFSPTIKISNEGVFYQAEFNEIEFNHEDKIKDITLPKWLEFFNRGLILLRRYVPILTIIVSLITVVFLLLMPFKSESTTISFNEILQVFGVLDQLSTGIHKIGTYVVFFTLIGSIIFFVVYQIFIAVYSIQELFNYRPNYKKLLKYSLVSLICLLLLSLIGPMFDAWIFGGAALLTINVSIPIITYAIAVALLYIFTYQDEKEIKYVMYLCTQMKHSFGKQEMAKKTNIIKLSSVGVYVVLLLSLFIRVLSIKFLDVFVVKLNGFSMLTYKVANTSTSFLGDNKLPILLTFIKPLYLIIFFLILLGIINNMVAFFSKKSVNSFNIKNTITIFMLFLGIFMYLIYLPHYLSTSQFELNLYKDMMSTLTIINLMISLVAIAGFIFVSKKVKEEKELQMKAFEFMSFVIFKFKYLITFIGLFICFYILDVLMIGFIHLERHYNLLAYVGIFLTPTVMIPLLCIIFKRFLNNKNLSTNNLNSIITILTVAMIGFIGAYVDQIVKVFKSNLQTNLIYVTLQSVATLIFILLVCLFIIVNNKNKASTSY